MSPSRPRIQNFKKFWPFYLGEHSKPGTRWLHFAGTVGATMAILVLIVLRKSIFIPLTFVYGYGLAWTGHLFVEKNRPASFRYPLWSFLADYKMCALILFGRIGEELRQIPSKKPSAHEELL